MPIARTIFSGAVRSGQRLAALDAEALHAAAARGGRVMLKLQGVRKTALSVVLRFSVSGEACDSVVMGNIYTYGEGPADGMDGMGGDGRFAPMELSVDITDSVAQLPASGKLSLYLHILDAHERELVQEGVVLDGLEVGEG